MSDDIKEVIEEIGERIHIDLGGIDGDDLTDLDPEKIAEDTKVTFDFIKIEFQGYKMVNKEKLNKLWNNDKIDILEEKGYNKDIKTKYIKENLNEINNNIDNFYDELRVKNDNLLFYK